jgi:hypothetical protein
MADLSYEEIDRKIAEHLRAARYELEAIRALTRLRLGSATLHSDVTRIIAELARLHEIWT